MRCKFYQYNEVQAGTCSYTYPETHSTGQNVSGTLMLNKYTLQIAQNNVSMIYFKQKEMYKLILKLATFM